MIIIQNQFTNPEFMKTNHWELWSLYILFRNLRDEQVFQIGKEHFDLLAKKIFYFLVYPEKSKIIRNLIFLDFWLG